MMSATDPSQPGPKVMGILNLTPDSFSDGGLWQDPGRALDQALKMEADGADWIDLGAESTRPGAMRIDVAEQWCRLEPVLKKLAGKVRVPLSVDTTRSQVAQQALGEGVQMINDVSAGLDDPDMLGLAARSRAWLVLMHKKGDPAVMQQAAQYRDVMDEVKVFLQQRLHAAVQAGVERERILLDPGIGFSKTTAHNLALLGRIGELVSLGQPVLLGASRKRFLGEILGEEKPENRDIATAATTACGVLAGVRYFRVHDVAKNREAADVAWALSGAGHRS